jgi:hypothetical protein
MNASSESGLCAMVMVRVSLKFAVPVKVLLTENTPSLSKPFQPANLLARNRLTRD